jgi:hypothetical protein
MARPMQKLRAWLAKRKRIRLEAGKKPPPGVGGE